MSFMVEVSVILLLLVILVYELGSQRHAVAHAGCVVWCLAYGLLFLGRALLYASAVDGLKAALAGLTGLVLVSVQIPLLEVHLATVFALVGRYFLINACDGVAFYAGLELANLAVVILGGRHTRSVFSLEATLLFLLQSALASGFMMLGLACLYVTFGHAEWLAILALDGGQGHVGLALFVIGLVWKVGSAPVHAWVLAGLQSNWSQVAFLVSTVPKLAVYWVWQHMGSALACLAIFPLFLGAALAFGHPLGRGLLAYSSIAMNGMSFLALETCEGSALWLGLAFYNAALILVWPLLTDPCSLLTLDGMRGLAWILTVTSLAGLPPFVGFIAKAALFTSAGLLTVHAVFVSVMASVLSVTYYLFLVLLSSLSDAGATLYQSSRSTSSVGLSRCCLPSASCLVGLLVAFWKCTGLALKTFH